MNGYKRGDGPVRAFVWFVSMLFVLPIVYLGASVFGNWFRWRGVIR